MTQTIPDTHQDTFSKTVLGFWIYLMTDCLLFATLFATYGVLHAQTFGSANSSQIFSLSHTFLETLVLLFSSLTCGLSVLAAVANQRQKALRWLAVTFALGLSFLGLEFMEFHELVQQGYSWQKSAFLSSFFALVGTHGLHILTGLVWCGLLMVQLTLMGITPHTFRRLVLFSLFWHFLDLIWIFIFTFVYLMGVL